MIADQTSRHTSAKGYPLYDSPGVQGIVLETGQMESRAEIAPFLILTAASPAARGAF